MEGLTPEDWTALAESMEPNTALLPYSPELFQHDRDTEPAPSQ